MSGAPMSIARALAADPPRPAKPDPWRAFSCAIGCLIVAGASASDDKWNAAIKAHEAALAHIKARGGHVNLHETVLLNAFEHCSSVSFRIEEMRKYLHAAMQVFTRFRTLRAVQGTPEAQPNYWWNEQ